MYIVFCHREDTIVFPKLLLLLQLNATREEGDTAGSELSVFSTLIAVAQPTKIVCWRKEPAQQPWPWLLALPGERVIGEEEGDWEGEGRLG